MSAVQGQDSPVAAAPEEHLRVSRRGRMGHIVLNRPSALNALDEGMCVGIHRALDDFAADGRVGCVVISSSSPKAFCAGGDIKAVRELMLAGRTDDARSYFTVEYAMNQAIADSATPYVAIMNGATMGGGLGVSMHGAERVVTDTLTTAMPETAIGFVPDVGASWTLPRLCGGGERGLAVARYLGLTGTRMGAADALYTGLATRLVRQDDTEELLTALAERPLPEALDAVCVPAESAGPPPLAEVVERVEHVFGAETVAGIRDRLEAGPHDDWYTSTRDALAAMSPTSMVATLELFAAGARAADLAECLRMELELGVWICARPDFLEGVRAVLVDKTRDATWRPASPAEVDVAAIRVALGTAN